MRAAARWAGRLLGGGSDGDHDRQVLAGPTWMALPVVARLYVAAVIAVGVAAFVQFIPRSYPSPAIFILLLVSACLMSAWKITLPISVANGSTLSVADAANVMSLLLLGPNAAVLIAVAGVWTQCTYRPKQPYPLYRTVFSMAAAAVTMVATGAVYAWLGGGSTSPDFAGVFAKPLVGALATYFVVNTTLVAAAIALSAGRTLLATWREDFLWSASSFMVAGATGALGAVVVARGEQWKAVLLLAPIYLTYRTYESFVGRLDDEQRHTEQMRVLHEETVMALQQAREAERALAEEKERLASALTEMTRLEELRHQSLEREQAARASAEMANRVKDQFLAVVSHELRTPLNAILGWADMLCRRRLDDGMRERATRTIRDSAKRQARLIDDLLDVARISSGKLRLERTRIDLRAVVADALQVVQPVAEAKGVHLVLDAAPEIDAVYGDAARLQQVAWNLLSNAVKFTPPGGSVQVRLRQAHNTIEMAVIDSGQGIATDFLPWVFDPFRQADGSSTRVHPGLGLGLAIVKSLVEAHDGTVTAQSEGHGRGAMFVVQLPAARSAQSIDPTAAGAAAAIGADGDALLQGVSVLLVDDDVESLDVVAAHLHHCGADVITAVSVSEALDVFERAHVDVLVSDIGMPGEDGYSLIRRLRAEHALEASVVPAIALTALARQEDRQRALHAGFQSYFSKPVDPVALVRVIASLHGSSCV